MRHLHLSDMHLAALALAQLPPVTRQGTLETASYHAHCADKYRKRLGKCHPRWGNGTLTGALPSTQNTTNSQDYRDALLLILHHLKTRAGQNFTQM